MLEKVFKLSENKTDAKTEILAGITTFMTMAYILAVNPSILSATGMDSGAVFTATALAAFIGTLLMAIFANYPFALAPGMGLNAYFAYTVVLGMGYSWEYALTAVFAEGIIFILLSATNVREAIFNAIPQNLKAAVSVGIGLFIAFIGLQNAKIVIGGSTLLQLFSVDKYNEVNGVSASFNDVGITVLLAIIGIIVTGILVVKNIKGNILWGILITWLLGIICQFTEDIYTVVKLIKKRKDMTVISEKDYIRNIKESGYRSYHIIVHYEVETVKGTSVIPVEIQIRTLGMNFWAIIEHSLQYKYDGEIPLHVRERLNAASDALITLDNEMSSIHDEIINSQTYFMVKANIVSDILSTIQNLYKVANKQVVIKIQDEFYEIYEKGDINELSRFSRQLDIIAEDYRAQSVQ